VGDVVMRWWRRERALTCPELVELVTEYTEGAMSPTERARFEAHVDACEGCAEYVSQMAATTRLLSMLRSDSAAEQDRDTGLTPKGERLLLDAFRTWHANRP
jgi:predicted anti-sigma-YlaC factor YlaD